MYKISIYGCAMFKKLVCQWDIVSCRHKVYGTSNRLHMNKRRRYKGTCPGHKKGCL